MKKIITIDDQSVELNSSAGWFYDYREQFGHDIMPDLLPILEGILGILGQYADQDEDGVAIMLSEEVVQKVMDSLATMEMTTIFNIVWAMAHNADQRIKNPRAWANSFEKFPMDEVLPELVRLLLESCMSSKNVESLLNRVEMIREK